MKNTCCRLNPLAFALAVGLTWAIGLFVMGLLSWWFGWASGMVSMLSTAYVGYSANFWGSVLGLIWGFVDGFIGGIILAWIYNGLLKCCGSSSSE